MPHAISPLESRALDFHDLSQLDQESQQRAVDALGSILEGTLSSLHPSWAAAVRKPDQELRTALQEWRTSVFEPMLGRNKITDYYFDCLLAMGEHCMSTIDIEQRIHACKLAGTVMVLDDQIPKNPALQKEAECFLRNLVTGNPTLNPVLQKFGEYIRIHADMMTDPVVSDYLWWSWLNFIIGTNIESRTPNILSALQTPLVQNRSDKRQHQTQPVPTITPTTLPHFIRRKSGFCEAWALTIFAQNNTHPIPMDMWLPIMPDVENFLNLANDLLSAPKEILKCDTSTYLNFQTFAKRQVLSAGTGSDGLWCFEDTVVEACNWLVETVERLDLIVKRRVEVEIERDPGSQEVRDAVFVRDSWMMLKAGVVELHFDFRRYDIAGRYPLLERLRLDTREVAEGLI